MSSETALIKQTIVTRRTSRESASPICTHSTWDWSRGSDRDAEPLQRATDFGRLGIALGQCAGVDSQEKENPRDWQGLSGKRLKRLELSTFCMASRRSSQLSYSRRVAQYSRVNASRRPRRTG